MQKVSKNNITSGSTPKKETEVPLIQLFYRSAALTVKSNCYYFCPVSEHVKERTRTLREVFVYDTERKTDTQ